MHKFIFTLTILLAATSCLRNSSADDQSAKGGDKANSSYVVKDVDPSLFLTGDSRVKVSKVKCTLSDGTSTMCLQIESKPNPSDHQMGPWCPDNIADGPEAGGIWLKDGKVYDVDGAFIKNLASFFGDNKWQMYDSKGNVFVTQTKEDCENAANPNVGPEYANYCVECLPSYVANITQTYRIPITPVKLSTPSDLGRNGRPGGGQGPPPDRQRGDRQGPPPNGERPGDGNDPGGGQGGGGHAVRGIAFNGVRFDAPAPVDAILGAYTLAPFDDAGGHINPAAGYHYHAATGKSKEVSQSDGHAPMIGYAMDGHGLFALLDENGKEPVGLDECRGHYDETRGYHYHVDAAGNNNFINCLQGAVAE